MVGRISRTHSRLERTTHPTARGLARYDPAPPGRNEPCIAGVGQPGPFALDER